MEKNLSQTTNDTPMSFTAVVQKDESSKIVENCSHHAQCDCMQRDNKHAIKEMDIEELGDGEIKIVLTGNRDKQEIEEAIKRSKVI